MVLGQTAGETFLFSILISCNIGALSCFSSCSAGEQQNGLNAPRPLAGGEQTHDLHP